MFNSPVDTRFLQGKFEHNHLRAVKPAVSVSVICFSCRDESRQIYIAVGHFRDTLIVKCRESSRHMQLMSRIIATYINGVGD